MNTPDPSALLMGADPIPACASDSERALLEWAAANPLHTPHPGMTKDGSRYSAPEPGADKTKARTRVTTFCEALDDGQGLIRWRHRLLARGILATETLPAPDAEAPAIDALIGQALHNAGEKLKADIGTALHLACEHHLAGTGHRPPAPWDADVDAYAAMLAAHQLEPAMTEAVLWVPVGAGLCGTADLLVRGPWGDELRIVDIKTGSSAQRIGYACQLAAYSQATHRWTVDGWAPLPAIDQTTAYIAHLPAGSGTSELLAVRLDHRLVDLAATVRERRRVSNVAALFTAVEAPPTLFDATETPAPEAEAVAHEWITATDEMRNWFRDRVRTVAKGDNALALSRRWPQGVSPKEHGAWTVADMAALHEVLAHLESTEPPFPPADPPERGWTAPTDAEPVSHPGNWVVDEGTGPIDTERAEFIGAAFVDLDDERKALSGSWAKGGRIGGRPWAVKAESLTPRLLAVHAAIIAALSHLWDPDGGAPDCDLLTRAALSLVIGEDVQPGWETGAVLGALTIDQAERLATLARGFAATGEMGEELGAKALTLTA